MKTTLQHPKLVTALFLLLGLFINPSLASAQSTANYTFATGTNASLALDLNGNAVDLTTGATTRVAASADDSQNSLADIGFDFFFMGTLYNQFSVSDNGLLSLGAQPGTTTYALPNTTTATIAPFANDLRVGTNGLVATKVIGTAPNRCFVVEWNNVMIRYISTAAAGTGTFQARLYETTGTIEYVYGAMTTNAATPANYYIGFSDNTTVNRVVSVSTTSHTASTSATVTANSYTASSTITALNSAANGSRRYYRFTQTAPSAPTGLTFSNIATTSMTINWTDVATNELGYTIYLSTDNITFDNIGSVAANSTASSITGLNPNTVYYFKVHAFREGALSAGLTGSQITQTQVVFNSGNSTWTPPSCVSTITVETYGAGGGGGSSANGSARGGSGGGGGAYSKGTHTVTFGSVYYYNVGTGGSGGPAGSSTAPNGGGQTWFRATANTNAAPTTNVLGTLAVGGGAGVNNSNLTPTNGGALASGFGNVSRLSGVAGFAGNNNGGGDGGDAANVGSGGGTGGLGSNTVSGDDGVAPGGGGGGSDDDPADKGGNGGAGQVIITYQLPTAQSAAPVITGGYCAAATSISGTSTEANATIIEIFKNGVSQGTTTVTSNAWTKTGLTFAAADVITATATSTSPCKRVSVLSSSVVISAIPSPGTLTPNIAAGAICAGATVSATATAGTGGAGTIVDELEYNLSGGSYTTYVSGTSISTTGQNAVSIRTRRTATGSGCTSSSYTTVSWTVNAVPVSGTLTPNVAAGAVCAGQSVSATATAGSGGAGTILDELERSLSGGTYAPYISGTAISTTGQTSVSIRTRRTATGSGCTSSSYNTVTWTVNALPAAGTLTPNVAAGAVCAGQSVSATATAGSGGAGTITDELEYNLSGGSYSAYTSGTSISTTGQTSVSIRTRRTATGSGCTTSGYNSVTWTVNAVPASGNLTPTPAAGTICSGGTVSATATAGSGGAGTITDELQYSLSGGSYTNYTSGTAINTTGQTSISIRTRRTATGSGCTSSSYNTVTWNINARPTASVISGTASICAGSPTNIQVAITGGASPYSLVYSGGSVGSYTSGSNISVAPTTTTTYTITSVTDANGCLGSGNSGSAIVTIDSTTSTNGGVSWSNGSPSSTKSVIFDGSSATLSADLAACALRLTNNATVTVSSGFDVSLNGKLTVDSGSTFTLNNNANLLQNNTLANSGNIVVKRNSSALKRLDYTLWSSPVTGQGLYAFSPFTFGNRFYVYRTTTNLYNNADVGFSLTGLNSDGVNGTDSSNVQFAKAKGYLIRMPWDHPTAATIWNGSFTGVPNNGDITFTMTNGGAGQRFNLVGNPYPSPISMTQFVSDNSSKITGTLYFWRETNANTSNNAYCSWAGGTFTTNSEAQVFNPNGIIRTGQGFFVEASGASTTVDFKNGQRSSDNANQFFRTANVANEVTEYNRFWLNLTNTAGAFCQMAAGYITNATDGVDIYDGRNINNGNVLLNSILDNTDYTIQGKALPFNQADVVPLSYKVTDAGQYTIAIDHVDGLFSGGSQAIYLKDNLNSTEHNLQTGAYVFTSAAGTFNNRFEITYQSQLAVENPVFTENQVIIYKQNSDLVITTGSVIMKSVKVFDIRGRLLQEKTAVDANQTIMNCSTANAVLLVQITSENGITVTKKIVQ